MANRDLVIQIRIPRFGARRWAAIVLAFTVGAGVAAWAGVNWTMVNPGEKLTSGKINANFKAMADAITALQAAPPGTPQPHLILNQGNVDLGVLLTISSLTTFSSPTSAVIVYSPAVKAPLDVAHSANYTLLFDGANCTGNPYVQLVSAVSNTAFNQPSTGTIWLGGVAQKNVPIQSFKGGGCNPSVGAMDAIPVSDTKVPIIQVMIPGDVSIKMM